MLRMLREEGLDNVFARHRAAGGGGPRSGSRVGARDSLPSTSRERSPVVTTVMMPNGFDSDEFRRVVVDRLNLSLGAGLGRLKGRAFRIGHLGDFNELMLMGTLWGVEMGLSLAGVPFKKGGAAAAMESLGDFSYRAATKRLQKPGYVVVWSEFVRLAARPGIVRLQFLRGNGWRKVKPLRHRNPRRSEGLGLRLRFDSLGDDRHAR